MSQPKNLGTENVRWDLSCFYRNLDDPQIDADLKTLEGLAKDFYSKYRGKLGTELSAAIRDFIQLSTLADKLFGYLGLLPTLDLSNEKADGKLDACRRIWDAASGEFLTFFDLEIIALDQKIIDEVVALDPLVAKHKPWLDHIREYKTHILNEEVESALNKRASYGSSAWDEFFDKVDADLRFGFDGAEKTLEEMLNVMNNDQNPETRATALATINNGLKGYFAKYSAQTLNMIMGEKAVEDRERKYSHPMSARNLSNRLPDEIVEALHQSVTDVGGSLARRYYRLKTKLLNIPGPLAWSDRNAPLPFVDRTVIPFSQGLEMVLNAYEKFSPTLAGMIREMVAQKHIDAPPVKNKRSGAFNSSHILPGNLPASFALLNYFGTPRDVMTLAHELGHAVHGILAGQAQGPLMFHAPIAYAETASVFGERTVFNALRENAETIGKIEPLLALLCGKIDDILNTVVRQISFSNFERRAHNAKRRLSVEELSILWLAVTKELYGEEGDVFTYRDMEFLWSYIPHFHTPFYVYGYATGDIVTSSLYAQRGRMGADFEPKYLELLRAGSTKNAAELLTPFGLDPRDPEFWSRGLRNSLGTMIEEVEKLYPQI